MHVRVWRALTVYRRDTCSRTGRASREHAPAHLVLMHMSVLCSYSKDTLAVGELTYPVVAWWPPEDGSTRYVHYTHVRIP